VLCGIAPSFLHTGIAESIFEVEYLRTYESKFLNALAHESWYPAKKPEVENLIIHPSFKDFFMLGEERGNDGGCPERTSVRMMSSLVPIYSTWYGFYTRLHHIFRGVPI
jgi:hypothetical protein